MNEIQHILLVISTQECVLSVVLLGREECSRNTDFISLVAQ